MKAWLRILAAGSLGSDINNLTEVVFELLGSQIFPEGQRGIGVGILLEKRSRFHTIPGPTLQSLLSSYRPENHRRNRIV